MTPDQYCDALLSLYGFREIAPPTERAAVDQMLQDITDFMTCRNCQIWDLNEPLDAKPWKLREAYCNATHVLAQALAFHVTGEDHYRGVFGFLRRLLEKFLQQLADALRCKR
ncbi:MAG: hypothetical protein N2512_08565 [Armatimonadetes bacterium]|nr:hypothetical protein [Armatimonadota bacterium]